MNLYDFMAAQNGVTSVQSYYYSNVIFWVPLTTFIQFKLKYTIYKHLVTIKAGKVCSCAQTDIC